MEKAGRPRIALSRHIGEKAAAFFFSLPLGEDSRDSFVIFEQK